MHALPPAFVMLALLNISVLGALFFYLLQQQADRTELIRQMLDACITKPER